MAITSGATNVVRRTVATTVMSSVGSRSTARAMSRATTETKALVPFDFDLRDEPPAKKRLHSISCGDVLVQPTTEEKLRTLHAAAIPGLKPDSEVVFEKRPGHPEAYNDFRVSQGALGTQFRSDTTHDPCGGDPQPAVQKAKARRQGLIKDVHANPEKYKLPFVATTETLEGNQKHTLHNIDVFKDPEGKVSHLTATAALRYQRLQPNATLSVHQPPTPKPSYPIELHGLG